MMFRFVLVTSAVVSFAAAVTKRERMNEIKIPEGHTKFQDYVSELPHTYIDTKTLPDAFTWSNVDGVSYLTHLLNQHLPQYCGSCWAHGALSSFGDRIKIARKAKGDDINLSIQFILNCGKGVAGSCYGGYHTGVYEFIKTKGFVPYDTCMPYMACSSDSGDEGFCEHVDTTCSDVNTCRTCNTFSGMGGECTEIVAFPNATVAEYGIITSYDVNEIMAEIYARGPVAATINASPIVDYQGGIFSDNSHSHFTNHIVSIVGWGMDQDSGKKHWIVRNSWGHYWGEMGFIRVEMGKNILGLEGEIAWATPGSWTEVNFPCDEDGKNCRRHQDYEHYIDPSNDKESIYRRLDAGL